MIKIIRHIAYLFFILLLGLTGCSETQTPDATERAWDEELFFGVVPAQSDARTHERYARFIAYLEKQLNTKITLVVPEDYAGVIDGLAQKKLHFAILGPKSYVEASKRANVTTSVRVMAKEGQEGYKGLIITKKGSGLKTIADLKDKTWAFTDPDSTSGYLIPSVYFALEAQIDPNTYFSEVTYSGKHQTSILMVQKGEVDAAASHNIALLRDIGDDWQDEFNLIWESQLIPFNAVAYNKEMPSDLVNAFTQAMIAYKDPQGLADIFIFGFTPAKDEDYVFIRELIDFKEKLQQPTAE